MHDASLHRLDLDVNLIIFYDVSYPCCRSCSYMFHLHGRQNVCNLSMILFRSAKLSILVVAENFILTVF